MSKKFILSRVAAGAAMVMASYFAHAAVPDANNPAVRTALGYLNGGGATLARAALADAFNAKDLMVDPDGAAHVRFDRLHAGLRVIGGDLVVHLDATGNLRDVSQTLSAPVNLTLQPSLSAGEAEAFALSRSGALDAKVERSELVIHAHDRAPSLAHDVLVTGVKADGTPVRLHVIVDAHTRRVLDSFDEIQTIDALGSGNTLYSGSVPLHSDFNAGTSTYALKDLTRGSHFVVDMNNRTSSETAFTGPDAIWGTGVKTARDTVAADAAYGQNETWDFYLTAFGRNGIANDGNGARSRVHYSSNYDNAFWDDNCFCMTYGDGFSFNPLVSMDVAGHEMTHGVTSRTAGLIYSGESGGLNEGTSDIMGTMTEWFANNASDTPDYLIGEEISKTAGSALRYMYKPSTDGVSADCWYSSVGGLDVHYSSGVANHFFFLLAEGTAGAGQPKSPTCVAGNTRVATGKGKLKGIGRAKAQQIWYRALTVYMTASTNFAAARVATVQAATDLYGAGSKEVKRVGKAWDAVNRP
jgi:Zn-dependent metalloprotease